MWKGNSEDKIERVIVEFLEEGELSFWRSKGRFLGIIKQRLKDHLEQGLPCEGRHSCMFLFVFDRLYHLLCPVFWVLL